MLLILCLCDKCWLLFCFVASSNAKWCTSNTTRWPKYSELARITSFAPFSITAGILMYVFTILFHMLILICKAWCSWSTDSHSTASAGSDFTNKWRANTHLPTSTTWSTRRSQSACSTNFFQHRGKYCAAEWGYNISFHNSLCCYTANSSSKHCHQCKLSQPKFTDSISQCATDSWS